MGWELWAFLAAFVVIGAWWVTRAVAGLRRTARLGATMTDEIRRLDKERKSRPDDAPR